MKLTVEPLDKQKHDRPTFDCGLPVVNEFLQKQASRQMSQKINRTWVLVDRQTNAGGLTPIIGFYTLTNATIVRDELPVNESRSHYPGYPIPVFKLAWIGVDSGHQNNGLYIGESLLLEALEQANSLSEYSGLGIAVVTDPLTEQSERFFQKYGFLSMGRPFRDRQTLYLPLKLVKKLLG